MTVNFCVQRSSNRESAFISELFGTHYVVILSLARCSPRIIAGNIVINILKNRQFVKWVISLSAVAI